MKLLALLGNLGLVVYVVAVLLLTFHNLSRGMWSIDAKGRLTRFFMRQIVIMLWPFMLASKEGRHALRVIWYGKDDL